MPSSSSQPAGASLEDLSVIAAFVSVVRAGSFSGAARQLGMTKSAVSKRLARLEDRLGAQLLNRSTRAFSLTEAGQLFLDRALVILNDLDEAEKTVATLATRPCGLLRINAPTVFVPQLGPLIPQFIARHPDVHIDLTLDDHYVDVVGERYDLVIRIGRLADSNLMVRRLAAERLVLVGAPSYFERHGVPKTPQELFNHNCLRASQSSRGPQQEWRFVDGDGRDFYVQVGGNFSCSQGSAMREALVNGLGLGVLPTFVVAEELRLGRLRSVLDELMPRDITINAVYPPARHASLKVRVFIDFLARHLRETMDPPKPELLDAQDPPH
jgi:DNA-binding transcriptional LysR family regulator